MVLLPRGNPVKENVNPGKVNLPDALDKLRQGKFTGYLRFDFADDFHQRRQPLAVGFPVFGEIRRIHVMDR